jgi:hypothetical protein
MLTKVRKDDWTFSTSYHKYDYCYFPGEGDVYLVTGHNPTESIKREYSGKIYRNLNHIVIDTGTDRGLPTGCLCLETDEEFYVD